MYFMLLFFFISNELYSQIYFENNYSRTIIAAICYFRNGPGQNNTTSKMWVTYSWYFILPGQTREIIDPNNRGYCWDFNNETFYYYVISDNGAKWWGGNNYFAVNSKYYDVTNGSATVFNADKPYVLEQDPNLILKGFVADKNKKLYDEDRHYYYYQKLTINFK